MNILQLTPYNNSRATSIKNTNFGSNKIKPLTQLSEDSLLSTNEIVDNIFKLTKKIQFISKILGERDKTAKPVIAKIGDASIYINMDKSEKGKVKVDLYSDTNGMIYQYSENIQGYIPIENPIKHRQSLNMIINSKDKRMISGRLDIIDCHMDFERNTKTGKRELESNRSFYFVPNLYECHNIQDVAVQYGNYDKSSNIVTSLFFNLFSNLTKVKPEISLIK